MNKDLDERLVPQGQYRDAVNIQVRTTDGGVDGIGEAGTAQNIEGNIDVGTATGQELGSGLSNTPSFVDADFTCVGSVPDEKTNSAYFLFTNVQQLTKQDLNTTTVVTKMDTIVEQNVDSSTTTPVVVDIWRVHAPIGSVWSGAPTGTIVDFTAVAGFTDRIRENMTIRFYQFVSANVQANIANVKIKKIDGDVIRLYEQVDATNFGNATHAIFEHDRALNFKQENHITAINVIDDLLFWTDGKYEPKKINITRCKEGTDFSGTKHTQLLITNNDGDLEDAGDLEFDNVNNDLLEEHLTVLRPAPKTPPTLHINARDLSELKFTITDIGGNWVSFNQENVEVGQQEVFGSYAYNAGTIDVGVATPDLNQVPLEPGDILSVIQQDPDLGENPITFTVEFLTFLSEDSVIATPVSFPTNRIKIKVLTVPDEQILDSMVSWEFEVISLAKPKFELKFSRFGYRYKYEDGEYSAFSPFSELAFDPGAFDYDVIKGYNLGMVNTIRSIEIKDFIPYYTDRELDITEVEILYKSTDDANVYTIKSIRKVRDNEWELFTPNDTTIDNNNTTQNSIETGKLEIKSETIHRALESNQILRAFDNVPRFANAQEITGSRVVYGNYVQGFNLTYPVGLKQKIDSETVGSQPKKSVKTIRDYKVGMVFGDEYGRETPVIVSNRLIDLDPDPTVTNYSLKTDDVVVEKDLCAMSNKLVVQQDWNKLGLPSSTPDTMDWMDYVKYYVKETSTEYYNLVLDRWYYAQTQENVWLSFPSADRNKVDIETYLLLKTIHGLNKPVLEKARYKIIAIENEAPDFIKIDHRLMGSIQLADTNVINGGGDLNATQPNLLIDLNLNYIDIDGANYSGFLDNYGSNMRGDLYARIVGRTSNLATGVIINELTSGDFKKVTHHATGPGGGVHRIYLNESFGDSANMRDRFIAAGFVVGTASEDLQYFIEFEEQVVENKPEFDGRFFVLIEKDLQIEEHVEQTAGFSLSFVEDKQFTISYVDSQMFNPAQQGPYSYTDQVGNFNGEFSFTNGVYDGSLDLDSSGGSNLIDDPTDSPKQWWGWGLMSTSPNPRNLTAGDTDYPDSIQANFFGLGCQVGDFADGYLDELSVVGNIYPFGTVGAVQPVNDGVTPTINYGYITEQYWLEYRDFHLSVGKYSAANDLGLAIPNLVFLDGARAPLYDIKEFGTNINNTNQIGVNYTGNNLGNDDSIIYITNDDPTYGNGPKPSIFNYKPTALDSGIDPVTTGLCRIALAQTKDSYGSLSDWDSTDDIQGIGSAQDIYSSFTNTSTYFKFLDDTSNDGQPHVYKVIDKSIDGNMSIPIQYSTIIKNFGHRREGSYENLQFLQGKFNTDESSQYGLGILFNTDGISFSEYWLDNNKPNATWAGENKNCVDENGQTIDCFDLVRQIDDIVGGNVGTYVNFNLDGNDGTAPTTLAFGMFSNELQSVGGIPTYNKHFADKRTCGSCDDNQSGCNRHSIRFEFRRIDTLTGELLNQGIDPSEFDPRGYAKHDGTAGGIRIAIVEPTSTIGGKAIEIKKNRAVWETEPKESVDLDIYYEATHALPMKLKQGNTLAYAPLKSKVLVKNSNSTGGFSISNLEGDIDGDTYSNVMVGGAEYLADESIIKVISTNENGVEGLHTTGIGIGSTILFEHSSGLVTQSVVEAYYSEPTGSNVTYTPSTEFEVTITIDGAISNNLPQGTISITNQDGSAFDEAQFIVNAVNIGHGASVTGDDVPNGIFLKHFPGVNNQLSSISWVPNFDSTNSGTYLNYSFNATLSVPTGYYQINKDVYQYEVTLGWHNCYSFGNGVESDRIRDDFNAPTIDNGVRVSSTVDDYGQEDKTSSLIYSGLYNTTSGVNDLNEFNMAEKITKDLNPVYGSIQRLKSRDTDIITFCEDKILKILANKEAVFNADGNPQLTATDRVLGQSVTFVGDYGISKNPESLATDQYRMYFTDKQRGAVLRLSRDGLTPISNVGMKTFFRENLKDSQKLLGTFDVVNGEYNLTINSSNEKPTISFNEGSKGWVSFKSFAPAEGLSTAGKYLTVKDSTIYEHYSSDVDRNTFYNSYTESSITVMFYGEPGAVKSFKNINYEGSQARVDQNLTDTEYYNLTSKDGWWVNSFITDLQSGRAFNFKDKENKWFATICGDSTPEEISNIDTGEFTVQGIGTQSAAPVVPIVPEAEPEPQPLQDFTLTIQNDPND